MQNLLKNLDKSMKNKTAKISKLLANIIIISRVNILEKKSLRLSKQEID